MKNRKKSGKSGQKPKIIKFPQKEHSAMGGFHNITNNFKPKLEKIEAQINSELRKKKPNPSTLLRLSIEINRNKLEMHLNRLNFLKYLAMYSEHLPTNLNKQIPETIKKEIQEIKKEENELKKLTKRSKFKIVK